MEPCKSKALYEGSLDAGKVPGELLGRLLGGIKSDDPDLIVGPGIGRDAAAVRIGDEILVLKTDPITFASEGAARYLVNINANDLACLGATPRWMLVTALFPVGTARSQIKRTFAELSVATQERGISLVGGHTEVTPGIERPILIGMLSGIASNERFLKPGMAKTGDVLILSKPLAIEGTALLAAERRAFLEQSVGFDIVERAAEFLYSPGLSVAPDADIALATGGVRALHDPTEGGIAMGVREIAEASGLGVELNRDAIVFYPETAAIADACGIDPIGMLASGSLLIAAAPQRETDLLVALRSEGHAAARIGKLTAPGSGYWILSGDECLPLPTFVQDEVSRFLLESA
jgi:hydrogenase expression/formation protein HypE